MSAKFTLSDKEAPKGLDQKAKSQEEEIQCNAANTVK